LSHTDSQKLADTDPIQNNFQKRFNTLNNALALDVAENKRLIADLESWKK
jgi:hypothetical protein